jgi:hypothetical protein
VAADGAGSLDCGALLRGVGQSRHSFIFDALPASDVSSGFESLLLFAEFVFLHTAQRHQTAVDSTSPWGGLR